MRLMGATALLDQAKAYIYTRRCADTVRTATYRS
jgi:hypothetical protein